jgi:cardiolipin synthase
VQVFEDPHAAWLALAADLAAARKSIHIQLYMLRDDDAGRAFLAHLSAAARRGVVVELKLDAVGSWGLSSAALEPARLAGVRIAPFRQLTDVRMWFRRNHRKLIVVDGRVAWVGGRNITRDDVALSPEDATWVDLSARVEGPFVGQAEQLLRFRPRSPTPVAGADPGLLAGLATNRAIYTGHCRAVQAARSSVWLANAYFLPQRALTRALRKAAAAGLDVRVLMPGPRVGDVPLVAWASLYGVHLPLRRGVRIFLRDDRMLHAKMAVIDGRWWTLGSANLDPISQQRNLEANVVGVGGPPPSQLRAWFEHQCRNAVELTLPAWRALPWRLRALGWLFWKLRFLL